MVIGPKRARIYQLKVDTADDYPGKTPNPNPTAATDTANTTMIVTIAIMAVISTIPITTITTDMNTAAITVASAGAAGAYATNTSPLPPPVCHIQLSNRQCITVTVTPNPPL